MAGKTKKAVAAIAIILAAVVLVAWFMIDSLVATGIEKGGGAALGVPIGIDDVDVGVVSEDMEFEELRIDNPEGFSADHFITIEDGHLALSVWTLMEDTVQVPELHLQGIDLVLAEEGGKANYQVLTDRLGGDDTHSADTTQGPRIRLKKLVLEDVHVDSSLLMAPTPSVTIERIEVTDLTDEMTSGELTALVVRVLLQEVAKETATLPIDVAEQLGEGVMDVGTSVIDGVESLFEGDEDKG